MKTDRPGLGSQAAKTMLFRGLEKLSSGAIAFVEENGQTRVGTPGPLDSVMEIRDPRVYRRILLGGSLAAGETYMAGQWSTPDLPRLVRLFARNAEVLQAMDRGISKLFLLGHRILHALRRNTEQGSRKNIAAHYDLSNAFYSLWLDETRAYSAAIFESPEEPLKDASIRKFERICRKLGLGADHRVLEIGTGWGGFAVYAARTRGCHVTTTTISDAQYEYTHRLVEKMELQNRIAVLRQDYRALEGTYDRLVSIEMIEAVGHHYLESFLKTCSDRLTPEGMAALQAITIADQRFEAHVGEVDFIKRHIFPGSCIPSLARILECTRRGTDLALIDIEDISGHYAWTLRRWRERFESCQEQIADMGFDSTFRRMWQFYLAYCEGSFAERYNRVQQFVFAKAGCRDAVGVCAPSNEDVYEKGLRKESFRSCPEGEAPCAHTAPGREGPA